MNDHVVAPVEVQQRFGLLVVLSDPRPQSIRVVISALGEPGTPTRFRPSQHALENHLVRHVKMDDLVDIPALAQKLGLRPGTRETVDE